MDVFTWSIPFLAEKVTNMLYNIVKKGDDDDESGDINLDEVLKNAKVITEEERKKLAMKGKINSVARINRMFTTLREESELLLKIKNISPDGKLPRGILLAGKPAIKNGKILLICKLYHYSSQTILHSEGVGQSKRETPQEKVNYSYCLCLLNLIFI
jgi:polyhydroxyalkanoate synthesis regulator phasin